MLAATRSPLTAGAFAKAVPKDKPYELRSQAVRGLLLRVQPSGVRTFFVQFDRSTRVRLGDGKLLTLRMAKSG